MNALDARRRLLGRNVYKKTVEGKPAIAQGSLARRDPGITMQSWTEQAQYEGKNLFNLDDLLSLIPESGSDMVNVALAIKGLTPNTTYTLSATIEGDTGGDYTNRCLYIGSTNAADSVFVGHPVSKSSGDSGEILVYFYPFSDIAQDIKSGNGNVQLEEGTVPTSYEPYTGGQPSPSPDYPQPITSAGSYNEETGKYQYQVELTGANLFDASRIRNLNSGNNNPDEYRINGNEILARKSGGTINQMILEIGLSLKPGNYYFTYDSMEITNQNGETYSINSFVSSSIRETASGDVVVLQSLITPGYYTKVTIENDIDMYLLLSAIHEWESISELKIYGLRIVSNADTPFEPYKTPQTVTLTSDRPLTKWDKLEKRNGQWGWVYKSAEIVLDGSERWTIFSEPDGDKSFYILVDGLVNSSAFSNKYRYKKDVNLDDTKTFVVGRGAYRNSLWFVVPGFETVDDFKTFLGSQAQLQDPVIVWYETTEKTFVPLSESEQEQMNALYTFRPTTVLSNDCDCNMTLTYKTKKSLEVTT